VESCSGDFATKFRAFYKFSTEFARENREQLLVFTVLLIEFAGTGIELEKKMKEIQNNYTLIVQRLLEEGIRKGEIGREIDPVIYAQFITSTLVGSHIHWYLGNFGDPVYDRRQAIAQREGLLKVVLSGESSAGKTDSPVRKRSKS